MSRIGCKRGRIGGGAENRSIEKWNYKKTVQSKLCYLLRKNDINCNTEKRLSFKDLVFLSEGQSHSGDEPSFKIQNPSDLCSFLVSMVLEVIYNGEEKQALLCFQKALTRADT